MYTVHVVCISGEVLETDERIQFKNFHIIIREVDVKLVYEV